jgi:hypothetical protein
MDAAAAASVPDVGGLDGVPAIRLQERKRPEAFEELGNCLRTNEALRKVWTSPSHGLASPRRFRW